MAKTKVFDIARRAIPVATVVSLLTVAVAVTKFVVDYDHSVDTQWEWVQKEVGSMKETVSDGFKGVQTEIKGLREDHREQAVHRYQWEQWAKMFQMANPEIRMVEMPEPER